ncbi:MAG: serine--tRNA ligase [Candidatus Stygibacter australis]|nr:serine--tRNA ligase [Candidatus Stygibacter australis]MDP8323428.1 serine--tRNA ligase [Candidatus Stygibacter australis]
MIDLKYIRSNPELLKEAVINKKEKADIDRILEIDEARRKLQFDFDNLRSEQKKTSSEIPKLKKAGKDVSQVMERMKSLADELKNISAKLTESGNELDTLLLTVPNIPAEGVPAGGEENNQQIREWGEARKFNFQARDQVELAEINDLFDLKRAAKMSGSGFIAYTGKGAALERALINFFLDFHLANHHYEEISAPFIVNRETMTGTGQLPKLENDMYHIDQDDMFLIPTSEVSVTNFYAGEILPFSLLPRKFVSYSPCFRREAGSYGKDNKGLQRVHQFNKVEMVRFVQPETSYDVLDEMVHDAEDILQALGLHYRVVVLATGDLSFASAKTFDLEVWAPGTEKYLEVSSVSNFLDFQARRANIRFRDNDGKVKYLHTLNGSGLATPRSFIALIETWQNEDGTITIPPALRSYLGNREIL